MAECLDLVIRLMLIKIINDCPVKQAMQSSPLHSSLLAIEMRELHNSGDFESDKEDSNNIQVSLRPEWDLDSGTRAHGGLL